MEMKEEKGRIPVAEGLFTMPSKPTEEPRLIGSKCSKCGEVFFPEQSLCTFCSTKTVEPIQLSRRGKLFSYTNVCHQPPGPYKGPIPYGVGLVELPEGVIVQGRITEPDPVNLKPYMEVEMVLEDLYTEEDGSRVVGYAFKPIK